MALSCVLEGRGQEGNAEYGKGCSRTPQYGIEIPYCVFNFPQYGIFHSTLWNRDSILWNGDSILWNVRFHTLGVWYTLWNPFFPYCGNFSPQYGKLTTEYGMTFPQYGIRRIPYYGKMMHEFQCSTVWNRTIPYCGINMKSFPQYGMGLFHTLQYALHSMESYYSILGNRYYRVWNIRSH